MTTICIPLFQTLAPPAITAFAIVCVGYWVNTTIRRKSQRDAVLINYLQEIQRNIHQYICSAVETDNEHKRVASLRSLSNEIYHFFDLPIDNVKKSHQRKIQMNGLYFKFKSSLTDIIDSPNEQSKEQARTIGNSLKQNLLVAIFEICESGK